MPGLTPEHVQKIHKLLHDKKLLQAVKEYHDATGVSLSEAREAVEEMARNEYTKPPSGVRSYDDPVLEGKIKSLLSKGKKLDAIKIYREEYGIGLKEAKDAVERIEGSMPRNTVSAMPYEPAIGRDPFAEEDEASRRRFIVLGVALIVALCGVGGFLLRLFSAP
jgi:ribosomal protein L7/L12